MDDSVPIRKPAYKARVHYTERKARGYQSRQPGKEKAELRLVDRAFRILPEGLRILDIPCGGGRVTLHLAANGYRMTSADLSEPMLAIARENVREAGITALVERQDVEKLTYRDGTFDAVICFRLFHHFPNPEIRRRAVSELCRVASRFVIISYFSPLSYTSVKRRLRAASGGRRSHKHSTPLSEVRHYFEQCGFRFIKDFARMPLIHTLHLAVFERHGLVEKTKTNPAA